MNKNIKIFLSVILGAVLTLLVTIATFTAITMLETHADTGNQFRNWGLENTVNNSHVHARDAWKLSEGSKSIVVAVIDTGLDANHPDIKPNLWREKGTGYYGYDFVANKPNPIDDHGHGTHVAGIIGAVWNHRAGISGMAHKVSIMAVKYYSEKNTGAENLRNSIKALRWAINHGAKIINYSGGGPEFSGEEYELLKRARALDILVVAAAGNDHQNTDLSENYYYPCAYRLENIICVGATNIHNDMLPSSNWAKTRVDLMAPGENILSTVPGGKYAYMSGTSQATPFVTGTAVLLLAQNPHLKPQEIRQIIRASVDRLPQLANRSLSGGKLNAYRALANTRSRHGH
ncbi:MAG: S8 family peptidase [Candidatus Saccharimonadales bacterium]